MNSRLLFPLLVFAMVLGTGPSKVVGQSIIQRLMASRKGPGAFNRVIPRSLVRLEDMFEDIPMEQCRVKHLNQPLAMKFTLLCQDCERAFGMPNFNAKCRANCFDNPIARQCTVALMKGDLAVELDRFRDEEVKAGRSLIIRPAAEKPDLDDPFADETEEDIFGVPSGSPSLFPRKF